MKLSLSLSLANAALGAVFSRAVSAATCNPKPSYPTPLTADGWQAQLVATGLSKPRGIIFDTSGNLLLVQQGSGIVHLAFDDGGSTCLDVSKKTFLINATALNHGIALSNDGKTLYASSSEAVFSWSYDASAVTVSDTNQTLVTGMTNDDHTTRTLMMSQKAPGILLVSRGSTSNIDTEAELLSSGHSQIKAFDLNNVSSSAPYDFDTQGRLLGWGLRNSVGVAEEPTTGGIYSVENSADEIDRAGVDIHQNNPGEEMNYHGFLNASTENQGGNYGYPLCFALWNTSIPDLGSLKVGDQFTLDQNATLNDTTCQTEKVSPRLTFQTHMAPLDMKFLPNGTEAYISFTDLGTALTQSVTKSLPSSSAPASPSPPNPAQTARRTFSPMQIIPLVQITVLDQLGWLLMVRRDFGFLVMLQGSCTCWLGREWRLRLRRRVGRRLIVRRKVRWGGLRLMGWGCGRWWGYLVRLLWPCFRRGRINRGEGRRRGLGPYRRSRGFREALL